MANLIRCNVRVSPEVHAWFKERSESTGVSMSALMFLACEKYMHEHQFMNSGLPKLMEIAKQAGVDVSGVIPQGLSEAILDAERAK